MTIKRNYFIINQIFNENLCICLPAAAGVVAAVKGVLGVDERNNMPLPLYFNDFGQIVGEGLIDGCKERFFRFFVFADEDEYSIEAREFILKYFKETNDFSGATRSHYFYIYIYTHTHT